MTDPIPLSLTLEASARQHKTFDPFATSRSIYAAALLSSSQKLVALALIHHANDRGRCWPSVETIARECSLSKNTVHSSLRALRKAGIVRSISRAIDGLPSIYIITQMDGSPPLPPHLRTARKNHPTNAADRHKMRGFAEMNLVNAVTNPNENWMAEHLAQTGLKWRRQKDCGFRIYDFWCQQKGIAVEVDGPEHDAAWDAIRDEQDLHRSGILVLRVRNRNEQDAAEALARIAAEGSWNDRRRALRKGALLASASAPTDTPLEAPLSPLAAPPEALGGPPHLLPGCGVPTPLPPPGKVFAVARRRLPPRYRPGHF